VSWRAIYHVLKRLEFRGDVQRGYFVAGLAGAQFALPDAVEMLRAAVPPDAEPDAPLVMATSDPANVYSLALQGVDRESISRPRGSGAQIVTVSGKVILSTEARGRRVRIRAGADPATVRAALESLVAQLTARRGTERRRDVIVETIDGEGATGSAWAPVLRDAGFRNDGSALRFYAVVR
jgi:ATP-dependent Lhr-like helicase